MIYKKIKLKKREKIENQKKKKMKKLKSKEWAEIEFLAKI